MRVEIVRIYNCPTYCIGRLYVDGACVCDTLEDTDRGLDEGMDEGEMRKVKVHSKTAIPTGTYKVTMGVRSPKFSQYKFYADLCGGCLPRLVGVKCFEGVLLHCGSTAQNSSGCVLVGKNTVKGRLTDSQKVFTKLMKQHFIPAKMLGEDITLKITRTYKA